MQDASTPHAMAELEANWIVYRTTIDAALSFEEQVIAAFEKGYGDEGERLAQRHWQAVNKGIKTARLSDSEREALRRAAFFAGAEWRAEQAGEWESEAA